MNYLWWSFCSLQKLWSSDKRLRASRSSHLSLWQVICEFFSSHLTNDKEIRIRTEREKLNTFYFTNALPQDKTLSKFRIPKFSGFGTKTPQDKPLCMTQQHTPQLSTTFKTMLLSSEDHIWSSLTYSELTKFLLLSLPISMELISLMKDLPKNLRSDLFTWRKD